MWYTTDIKVKSFKHKTKNCLTDIDLGVWYTTHQMLLEIKYFRAVCP